MLAEKIRHRAGRHDKAFPLNVSRFESLLRRACQKQLERTARKKDLRMLFSRLRARNPEVLPPLFAAKALLMPTRRTFSSSNSQESFPLDTDGSEWKTVATAAPKLLSLHPQALTQNPQSPNPKPLTLNLKA